MALKAAPVAGDRSFAGNRPSLGIHAKSEARVRREHAKRAFGTVHDHGTARRWRLKRFAERLLNDKVPKVDRYGNERIGFQHRVAMCCRGTDGGAVGVWVSADGERASFKGLQTCGSVWCCPICGPKVAAMRRDEMNLAINRWLTGYKGEKGRVYFLTYTMQHDAETYGQGQLQAAERALAAALRGLKGSRAYRDLMAEAKAKGLIRAKEVTYGEMNGWHVHTHELLFAAPGLLHTGESRIARLIERKSLLYRIRKLWALELIKRGLAGIRPGDTGAQRFGRLRSLMRHCFTAQSGAYAAEYVAKFGREPESERGRWGIASEFTSAHLKRAQRCDHTTPMGLLNDAMDGDKRSELLFREYALAMKGRSQLFWSSGLKDFFDVSEIADEEAARVEDEGCRRKVCEITPGRWSWVIAHDQRFEVLHAAATGGKAAVDALIDALERAPPRYSAEFTEGRAWDIRSWTAAA